MQQKRKRLIAEIFENMTGMRRLFMLGGQAMEKKGEPTRAQLWLMFTVAAGEELGVKELARRFCMSSSAVTQLITGLAKQKLILRKIDPNDRRKLRLQLTKKGQSMVEKVKEKKMAMFGERLAVLTEEELQQLKAIQEKILV